MNKLVVVFIFLNSLLFQNCENPITPNDPFILDFIKNQSLPKPQPYKIIFLNRMEILTVFSVSFGEPSDCPSGCAYSMGFGLCFKNKIGWLYIDENDQVDRTQLNYFDIEVSDMYLFSNSFWNDLNEKDNWVYRYALLPTIVKDIDTPLGILNRIAQGLFTFIDAYLGELLLSNPKVITDKPTLNLLANLPVFQGDAYFNVREKAKELLKNLG